ncbi:hypothetical protein PIB30_044475 [Stylosanthes scabra]|uniref:Uncharacterized protein n=1 Tax=Stylosanthes scabra TaxID=79078 RepID=A0ABU6VF71_9FABA|nr:hypothetical protein [Stylosanthes scabra]
MHVGVSDSIIGLQGGRQSKVHRHLKGHDLLGQGITTLPASSRPGEGIVGDMSLCPHSLRCIVVALIVTIISSVTIVVVTITTSTSSASATSSVAVSVSSSIVVLVVAELLDCSLESGDQSEEFFSRGRLLSLVRGQVDDAQVKKGEHFISLSEEMEKRIYLA